MRKAVAVVGAGWTGVTAARVLLDRGLPVHIFEKSDVVGGHSRIESLNGVLYEPNGAHIFHTSNPEVHDFVRRFGMERPYRHKVVTCVHLEEEDDPTLLSWPIQLDELRRLSIWPRVGEELAGLPAAPTGEDFESFVVSMMGRTLYDLFIRDYTVKQWGRDPSELSSSFAPKRIDLRSSGDRHLFADRWEYFPAGGANSIIENIARPCPITAGVTVSINDIDELADEFDAVIITAPLDEFVGSNILEWRGIRMESQYVPTDDLAGTMTPGYVVNYPSRRYPYTRTVETKHATGQSIAGTVVSMEHPGTSARHYPVPTVDGLYERRNESLKREICQASRIPVLFAGRLANYRYINQDQAILEGFVAAQGASELF